MVCVPRRHPDAARPAALLSLPGPAGVRAAVGSLGQEARAERLHLARHLRRRHPLWRRGGRQMAQRVREEDENRPTKQKGALL